MQRPYQSHTIPALIMSGGETGCDMGALNGRCIGYIPSICFTTFDYQNEND